MRTHVLYVRGPQWRELAERADKPLASPAFRATKAEGRTRAGFLTLPDGSAVFIKQSPVDSWWDGLRIRLTGSPAFRALRGARMLEAAQIAHPSPLAVVEQREWGLVRASCLISEAILEGDTLSRFALGPGGIKGRDARRRRRILDAVARQVRRVHDAGLYTRDMQETNVIVADGTGEEFRVWFLDLEDFRKPGHVTWAHRMRNLVHLDRSIGRFLCKAARLAFLYSYLGEKPARAEARQIVKDLLYLRSRVDRRRSRRGDVCAVEPIAGVDEETVPARGGSAGS